jgi:hypothetical protein
MEFVPFPPFGNRILAFKKIAGACGRARIIVYLFLEKRARIPVQFLSVKMLSSIK